ncbi:MAG: CDP-alcohol phosphatidyltransferase family protein [Patescibacteria group bacterium]
MVVHYLYDKDLLPLSRANAANYISLLGAWLSRIGLLCFFVYLTLFGVQGHVSTLAMIIRAFGIALFVMASTCDGIDGYVARKLKIVSKFGEIYDPHLDKAQYITKVNGLMIDAAIAALCGASWQLLLQALIISWITQERDLTNMFHRLWSIREDPNMKVSARPSGKLRTIICFPAILLFFLVINPLQSVLFGWILTFVIFTVTAYSAYDYVRAYRVAIKKTRYEREDSV